MPEHSVSASASSESPVQPVSLLNVPQGHVRLTQALKSSSPTVHCPGPMGLTNRLTPVGLNTLQLTCSYLCWKQFEWVCAPLANHPNWHQPAVQGLLRAYRASTGWFFDLASEGMDGRLDSTSVSSLLSHVWWDS